MDTTRLRDLVTANGPFASVYFDATHDTADAAKLLDLRWRELREELAGQGAPEQTLRALDEAVRDGAPPVGRAGRGLVAAGDTVLVDQQLDEAPAQPVARFSALPYLLPLAEYGELPPAHVVAVADHIGADLRAVDQHGRVIDERAVEGADHPVHKVRTGGWAQRDIQAHTDEVTRHNIEQAAQEVATAARRIGATLVVVAGESQARKELHEALPEQVRRHAMEVGSGDRHKGAAGDELRARVDELLADTKRARRAEAAERFRGALGQRTGLAVQGLEATATALREANVETLLAGHPGDAEVLTGPDPTLVALNEEELRAHGAGPINRRRADEALVTAAIAGGANLVHADTGLSLEEEFGAILRHD